MGLLGKPKRFDVDTFIGVYAAGKKFAKVTKEQTVYINSIVKRFTADDVSATLKGGNGEKLVESAIEIGKLSTSLAEGATDIAKDADSYIAKMKELNKDKAGFSDIEEKIKAANKQIAEAR